MTDDTNLMFFYFYLPFKALPKKAEYRVAFFSLSNNGDPATFSSELILLFFIFKNAKYAESDLRFVGP